MLFSAYLLHLSNKIQRIIESKRPWPRATGVRIAPKQITIKNSAPRAGRSCSALPCGLGGNHFSPYGEGRELSGQNGCIRKGIGSNQGGGAREHHRAWGACS